MTDFFLKSKIGEENTLFQFKIISVGIYTGFLHGRTVSEKLPKIPLFGRALIHQLTASWISATSAKWSPFNFIFNLGSRKYSCGDKSGEYGVGGWGGGDKGL